jgi:SAM-dependent methyltransferase
MPRPITKKNKSSFRNYLINSHQKVSHNKRVELIANELTEMVNVVTNADAGYKCIDIGCGDMAVAEFIGENLKNTQWKCLDLYPVPEGGLNEDKWLKYQQFNGKIIPFENKKFDIAFLVDVLHHSENVHLLLEEAKRVSDLIVVKEHYEYGFFSRFVLKAMDLYGNWAYGVKVPGKYFSRSSFTGLCNDLGLQIVNQKVGIDLYNHLPVLNKVLDPKWQFIAVLKPAIKQSQT